MAGSLAPATNRSLFHYCRATIAYGLAMILRAYLWFCYHTSTFAYTNQLEASLRETSDAGVGMVYLFWHDEFMLVALTTFSNRLIPKSIVIGTQFGGLVSARFSQSMGIQVILIDRSESRDMRIARLERALRRYPKLGIAADFGAPWYSARPTSLQIAYASNSLIVPVHVKPNRRILFTAGGARSIIPLPFSNFEIHAAPPIRPSFEQAQSDTGLDDQGPQMLNRVLDELRQ